MIYHIVVGDMAAVPLQEAIQTEPSMEGVVVVLRDLLHIGPIQRAENQTFSKLRTAYWEQIIINEKELPIEVDDQERLVQLLNKLNNDEDAQVWFWMAPWPADVSGYYFTLMQLQKHLDRLHLLNLAGLPFLDEDGKLYYPKNLSEISAKELIKARKLARQVTPAELEVDGAEWEKLVAENGGIRVLEGGKKLVSKAEDYYDSKLIGLCTQINQKAHKVVMLAIGKQGVPTADTHLGWRLRVLAEAGTLVLQGEPTKTLKDFSVKLPGDDNDENPTGEETAQDV